jgi:excisionase family DNA binding protein
MHRKNDRTKTTKPMATSGPVSDRLLSVAEVADRLHVNTTWVYQQSLAGRLPSRKIGRYLRFDPREVDAFVEAAPRGARASA